MRSLFFFGLEQRLEAVLVLTKPIFAREMAVLGLCAGDTHELLIKRESTSRACITLPTSLELEDGR
jgi:hypothetical protein